MPTYTRPVTASLQATGLTTGSALGYRVEGLGGSILRARTTAGIAERGTSAEYYAEVANFDTSWSGYIVWDAGAGDLATESFLAYAPQTGDTFVRIGAAGAGLSALGDARLANLDAPVSAITPLTAAGVRAAVGLGSANLDTQLGTLATASALSTVSTNVSAIHGQTTTTGVRVLLSQTGLTPRVLDAVADNALDLRDAFVATIAAAAGDVSRSGTVLTLKTPAGTTVRTFGLDDADNPSSRT